MIGLIYHSIFLIQPSASRSSIKKTGWWFSIFTTFWKHRVGRNETQCLLVKLYRDLTRPGPPRGSWGGEITFFQGNLGWWNILVWSDVSFQRKVFIHTPWNQQFASENRSDPKRKWIFQLPTINFQVRTISFGEGTSLRVLHDQVGMNMNRMNAPPQINMQP